MKHPAYQLRTNKAVDRLLLVNVLRTIDPDCEEFTYYSLAGPFLEDLRVMDHFFPKMRLVSLEGDLQTFNRQKFNKFSRRIELQKTTLADFLTKDYKPGIKDVFWLDYTDLTYPRLSEFQTILKQAPYGSVIRITLRAEPPIDISDIETKISSTELERLKGEVSNTFKNEFDKVLEDDLPVNFIFSKGVEFARIVQNMVRRSASLALDNPGSDAKYLPLQSTRYNDGTQMLSITGIICKREETELVQERLKTVRFANFDWHSPDRIDLPVLSIKEQLHLEPHLPVEAGQDAGEILHKALDYVIAGTEPSSKKQLAHYADCHRDYPSFVRISM